MGLKTVCIDIVNTTTVVVLFGILFMIFYTVIRLGPPTSEKAGKESQYSPASLFFHLGGGWGRDKWVSEPRFRRFWKSLRLRMYLHSNVLA